MSFTRRIALIASVLLPLGAAAASNPADGPAAAAPAVVTRAADPASFRVFVDLPTGYMFVSTPKGWRFRGVLAPERYAQLPAGTYVSLVPAAQVSAPALVASAP